VLVAGIAVLIGLVVGLLLPPRHHRVARPRPRSLWILFVGVTGQIVAASVGGGFGLALVLASYATLIAFALRSSHLQGTGVVAVGLGLNALVVAINGGMAVHPQSLVDAGIVRADQAHSVQLAGHRHLEDSGDHLTILDDRIPLPPAGQVLSFGDLILAVGAADVVAHIARRGRAREHVIDLVDEHGLPLVRADGTIDLRRHRGAAPKHAAGRGKPAVRARELQEVGT
jgi:hypothetical protein